INTNGQSRYCLVRHCLICHCLIRHCLIRMTLLACFTGCCVTAVWGQPSPPVTVVSAASYTTRVATESIASAFGTGMANQVMAATTIPLPTVLAGSSLTITDSAGVARPAPLFFVSPNQINFQIPAETAAGNASVTALLNGVPVAAGNARIETV